MQSPTSDRWQMRQHELHRAEAAVCRVQCGTLSAKPGTGPVTGVQYNLLSERIDK